MSSFDAFAGEPVIRFKHPHCFLEKYLEDGFVFWIEFMEGIEVLHIPITMDESGAEPCGFLLLQLVSCLQNNVCTTTIKAVQDVEFAEYSSSYCFSPRLVHTLHRPAHRLLLGTSCAERYGYVPVHEFLLRAGTSSLAHLIPIFSLQPVRR